MPGPTSRSCHALRRLDIATIVDLRTPSERVEDPTWESAAAAGLTLRLLPVPDRHAPTPEDLEQGCSWVLAALGSDERMLICCRAGAQRSATLATAVPIRTGYRLSEAFSLVSAARRVVNPSDPQVAALRTFSGNP